MTNKLENLDISEVSFVDSGANQLAHIKLFKRNSQLVKIENGKQHPSSDYVYVPDENNPETWKMLITSSPGGHPDKDALNGIVKSITKKKDIGIPEEHIEKVKEKIRIAWRKANPEKEDSDMPAAIRKYTWIETALAKAMSFNQTQAHEFFERNLYMYFESLRESLNSIIEDESLSQEQMKESIGQSVAEFGTALQAGIVNKEKSEENMTPEEIEKRLEELESETQTLKSLNEELKGENETLKDELEKAKGKTEEEIEKAKLPEDIRKQLEEKEERIAKLEDEKKDREYMAKAKSYENVPGTQEEIADMLKKAGDAGGDLLAKVEAVLASSNVAMAKHMIEKGASGSDEASVIQKVDALTSEIMKENQSYTVHQARAKVWKQHPELRAEYNKERNGK